MDAFGMTELNEISFKNLQRVAFVMLCYDAHYFGSYTRAISGVLTSG